MNPRIEVHHKQKADIGNGEPNKCSDHRAEKYRRNEIFIVANSLQFTISR